MADDLLEALSADQKRAVAHPKGPLRVVGGPGGGKTRVLTRRIAWLVRGKKVAPETILALTFTNKAAEEMKSRLVALLGDEIPIAAGTIHSWAYRFLCVHRGKDAGGILGAWNPNQKTAILADARQYFAWQKAVQEARVDVAPAHALHVVSRAKNDGVSRDAMRRTAEQAGDRRTLAICEAWARYEAWQLKMRAIDFDDLLVLANELLERPEIQKKVRKTARWVLLDESQDVNLVQWGIVRKLAPPPSANLTVVGDYDQSIYGWRGAAAASFLDFVQDYRATTITLETNYRSTRTIVDLANRLIGHNASREDKRLRAASRARSEPIVRVDADGGVEASRGVEQVRRWLQDWRPADVAVLVRAWWLTRAFEERLLKARIPYRVVGGPGFFGRREVLDLVAYVALAVDPTRDSYLQRILNAPNRYLGETAWKALHKHATSRQMPAIAALSDPSMRWPKSTMADRAMDLYALVRSLQRFEGTTRDLVQQVIARTGYLRWLERECEPEEFRNRKDNIDELLEAADEHPEPGDFVFYAEQLQPGRSDDESGVTLTSIHGAKGLEFPCVIVAGCAERLLPHERCEDVEEERRLFYVAVTRAERQLMLSTAAEYRHRGHSPSRFLREMGLDVPEIEPATAPATAPEHEAPATAPDPVPASAGTTGGVVSG